MFASDREQQHKVRNDGMMLTVILKTIAQGPARIYP